MLKGRHLCIAAVLFGLWFPFSGAEAQNKSALADELQRTLDTTVAHVYDNLDSSVAVAEQTLEQSLANGLKKQELRSYYCLGLAYYYKGYYLVSNDYYGLIANDPKSGPKERSAAWNNMGVNFEMLRQFDSSLYTYQKSMEIDKSLGDQKSEHMVLINMGLLNHHVHRIDLAFSETRTALDYFTKTDDRENMALCYMNFGIFYDEQGKADSSLYYNGLAQELYEKLQDIPNLMLAYNNRINTMVTIGEYGKAKEIYYKALTLLPLLDSPYHTAAMHAMASSVFSHTGEFDSAIVHSKEAIRMYEELSIPEYVVREHFFLARVYAEAGRIPEFKAAIVRYDSLNIELNVKELSNRLAEVEVRYKLDSKNKEIRHGEAILKDHQRFIILISLFALCLLLALIKTYALYAEVKKANRNLYLKNIELMEHSGPSEPAAVADSEPVREGNGLLAKFRKILTENELYKNSELSLRSASQELGTNEKYLSQAINAGGGDNFNTFVNRFRVNEARRIILEGKHNDIGMEELGLMVGFSNRHTFSRAFTQIAGISPSVFKKIHLSAGKEG